MTIKTKFLAQAGILAAMYATVTIILAPISYGPIQVRVAEALTVLPYISPAAIPGLYVGCLIANIYGGNGLVDILAGSAITFIAALATYFLRKTRQPWLAPLPPVVFNALGVSFYLHKLFHLPYWLTAGYIAIGQTSACFLLGYPLLLVLLKKRNKLS